MSIRPRRTNEAHGTSSGRTVNKAEGKRSTSARREQDPVVDEYHPASNNKQRATRKEGVSGGTAAKHPSSKKYSLLESILSGVGQHHGSERAHHEGSRRRHEGKHEACSGFERTGRSRRHSSRLETSVRSKYLDTDDHPRKHVVEVRRYSSTSRLSDGRPAEVPANDSHPLLVGDFTRAAVVLGEVRERMSRDVGGAPDSDIAADGAPGDAGRRFSKPGGAGKEGTSIFSTNTPKRSADPNDTPGGGPAAGTATVAADVTGRATIAEISRRSTLPPAGGGPVTRRTEDLEVGEDVVPYGDRRVTDPDQPDEIQPGGWSEPSGGAADGGSQHQTRHDLLDDAQQPGEFSRASGGPGGSGLGSRPGSRSVRTTEGSIRGSIRSQASDVGRGGGKGDDEVADEGEDEPPPPNEDDDVQPPDEEGEKPGSQPPEETFNRDVFLMSILLILATSYAWNIIQSCTTELKFAFPNVYAKRGFMAPWYLAALLRGAISLVKLGELYDDVEQVNRLDAWTVTFMKTLGLSMLMGEIQCEVLMPGLPTSPAFWFFLGAIPFVMKINAENDPDSSFSRVPDIYLAAVLFLQMLMGISAKRWLMLFNPLLLALAFFDHDYNFSSDAYLYMILLNLFYAVAIDKRLHGGPCPPPVPPGCSRCG